MTMQQKVSVFESFLHMFQKGSFEKKEGKK